MLAQGSEGSVATEQQRAHDRLIVEETAEVSAALLWGHNTFVTPTGRLDLPTCRLREGLAIGALIYVLIVREDVFTLLFVFITRHVLVRRLS